MRTRAQKQRRFFKAKVIKFNRKLSRMGEKVLEPKNFSHLMIEGNTLVIFMTACSLNGEGDN